MFFIVVFAIIICLRESIFYRLAKSVESCQAIIHRCVVHMALLFPGAIVGDMIASPLRPTVYIGNSARKACIVRCSAVTVSVTFASSSSYHSSSFPTSPLLISSANSSSYYDISKEVQDFLLHVVLNNCICGRLR